MKRGQMAAGGKIMAVSEFWCSDISVIAGQFLKFFTDLQSLFLKSGVYDGGVYVAEKADKGRVELVSALDCALEAECIGFLQARFPGVPIVSEETPSVWPPPMDTFWVIDPLDGTHNFLCGLPNFGAMFVFVSGRQAVFSAIFLPFERAIGRSGLYVAGRGAGTWEWDAVQPRRLAVSRQADLGKSFLFLEGPSPRLDRGPAAQLKSVVRRYRINLGACWSATRVAIGGLVPVGVDLMVSSGNSPWDNLPAALLIEEAGGRVTDFQGRPWSVENFSDLVFSGGYLHDAALAVLGV